MASNAQKNVYEHEFLHKNIKRGKHKTFIYKQKEDCSKGVMEEKRSVTDGDSCEDVRIQHKNF
jgi:hypothetical protein